MEQEVLQTAQKVFPAIGFILHLLSFTLILILGFAIKNRVGTSLFTVMFLQFQIAYILLSENLEQEPALNALLVAIFIALMAVTAFALITNLGSARERARLKKEIKIHERDDSTVEAILEELGINYGYSDRKGFFLKKSKN